MWSVFLNLYIIEVWIAFESFVSLIKLCGYLPAFKDTVSAVPVVARTHALEITCQEYKTGQYKDEDTGDLACIVPRVESFMFSRLLCSCRYLLASNCKPSSRIIRSASARCCLNQFLVNIETRLCSPHLLRGPLFSWNA